MNCIVFCVLLAAVLLEAKPYGYGGFGGNPFGEGAGTGLGGYNSGQSGFAHGGQYGSNLLNAGSSGGGSQGFHNQGAGEFHNQGHHHSKMTSINQAEESDAHNIGGSQAFNTDAQAGNGYNNYQNGINEFANQFAQGGASHQGSFI